MIDIDELARLEKAATPGNWKLCATANGYYVLAMRSDDYEYVVDQPNMRGEDLHLMCALRNTALEIIEKLKHLHYLEGAMR